MSNNVKFWLSKMYFNPYGIINSKLKRVFDPYGITNSELKICVWCTRLEGKESIWYWLDSLCCSRSLFIRFYHLPLPYLIRVRFCQCRLFKDSWVQPTQHSYPTFLGLHSFLVNSRFIRCWSFFCFMGLDQCQPNPFSFRLIILLFLYCIL